MFWYLPIHCKLIHRTLKYCIQLAMLLLCFPEILSGVDTNKVVLSRKCIMITVRQIYK